MAIPWGHAEPVRNFTARAPAADAKPGLGLNHADFDAGCFNSGRQCKIHDLSLLQFGEVIWQGCAGCWAVSANSTLVFEQEFAVFDLEAAQLAQEAHAK